MTRRLDTLASPDVGDDLVLVLPLGATEQHGPHLPLGTDTLIAQALADELSARRDRAVAAPALPVGASGEHRGFAGTLSIAQTGLELAVVELVRSADAFRGVLVVSWHGGNAEALARAAARLREERRRVVVWRTPPLVDAHAGRAETSLLLALAPELVRLERARPGATEPLAELLPRLRDGGVAAVSPTGILGDPTGASAEEGRRLFDDLSSRLAAAFDAAFPE